MSLLTTRIPVLTPPFFQNPPWPVFRGYHEFSFAHATMGHRLPTILGKAIDDVIRTLNEQSGESEIVDLVGCIKRMEVLMVDLSESAILRPIIDGLSGLIDLAVCNTLTATLDGEADVTLWNKEIAKHFEGMAYKDLLFLGN